MTHPLESWFDEEAGPLVRPYALTNGRTTSSGPELDMLTSVVADDSADALHRAEPEYANILRLCRVSQTVAELSAQLRLPLAVTKVLVGDLIGDRQLIFRVPVPTETGPDDLEILRAVLDGIHKL
ncbi:DUF742 domain-containing protein [Nocardia sp. CNY236]|uniref:DUF742 domain-containing protein n=1 Tax=Nocardia sp. CNY236 TaxID=1169152 RepID=UPI0003F71FC6|nr:DUF742 domain-containing protein [Nocardia sp. CNY236]